MSQRPRVTSIDSREMGRKLEKEFRLRREGEFLRCVLFFRDTVPESVRLLVRLEAPKTNFELVSVFLGAGAMHCGMDITLKHEAKETHGRVLFKMALRDAARVDFKGMLYIAPGADGSDSYLNARALLLSKRAIARIDPQLEILANDIKASHGSTVGRLAAQDLFYLRSRGLAEKEAEGILLQGYFADVLAAMPQERRSDVKISLAKYCAA